VATAVLLSGGLDSAVLLAEEASRGEVQPLYVSAGLAWEAAERQAVSRLLERPPLLGRARPLSTLSVSMVDVYPAAHWSIQGQPPAYATPDEEVYLPGRNVVLFAKASVYCALAKIERLVIGTLAHNPFPDATSAFRAAMADAVSIGLAHALSIEAPYAEIGKAAVIKRGIAIGVPLELTLSCMKPDGMRHCGLCSKCRERHDSFVEAGAPDPTDYMDRRHVSRHERQPS
jgi:7-cyano-7-deazaguanine synthase